MRGHPRGLTKGDETRAAESQSTTAGAVKDRMTRIGFAYNQKPEPAAPHLVEESERAEDEPPSSHRDIASRATHESAPGAGPALVASAVADAAPDDEFAEWDSLVTIDAVADALSALGDVVRLEATPDFPERLRAENPDIVFNIAEGLRGPNREGHVPAICEFFGIPYSGSDPFTLSLCLDKARTKEVLAFHGIPTAPFALVRDARDLERLVARLRGRGARRTSASPAHGALAAAGFPLFAKPVHEGSSKGITERNVVRDPDELLAQGTFLLERYAQPVLVETFLPGDEFTCAVLGNGEEAVVLPIVAMNFDSLPDGALPIYGFEAKWVWDRPERPLEIFECPARVGDALRREIERVTLDAYHALGCRDWSRLDVRLDAFGRPNVVEVNPLPGILPDPADNSCLPKAARAAGLAYDALIQRCLGHAAARQGVPLATSRRRARARAAG